MRYLLGLFSLLLSSFTFAAPILDVSGGILIGARGVSVNGAIYDVAFRDGSCASLYSGCDSAADLPFATGAEALAASRALLDQVFIDGASGNFDSDPSLIRGCEAAPQIGNCSVFTPVDTLVNNAVADSNVVEAFDLVRAAFTLPGEDLTAFGTVVYAVWTLQIPPVTPPQPPAMVPEPPTVALALMAAGLMLPMRRRRGGSHSPTARP